MNETPLSEVIHESFAPLLNTDGFLSPGGNQIMTTSEMIVCLDKNEALSLPDAQRFLIGIVALETTKEGGVFYRAIGNQDQEAQDDFVALARALFSLSHFSGYPGVSARNMLERIYQRGKSSFWDYNRPDSPWAIEATFFRFPHVCAHLTFCASEKPTLFQKFYWCLILSTWGLFFFDHKDQDTPKMLYMMHDVHDGSWICWKASEIWRKRFLKRFGSLIALYGDYYGASHPLAHWAVL